MRLRRNTSSNTIMTVAALALAGCGDASERAAAAGGGPVPLDEPEAVFPEDFGSIQTVREMPDGRVLVADPLGKALYLVDLDAGTRTVVGSEGAGPGEYLQPDAVWPLPGDSTLLVDLGNGRLVALGPDFSFGPTMPIAMGDPSQGGLVLAMPLGVDAQGRLYIRGQPGFGAQPADSGAVLRIDRADQSIDTVATYKLQTVIRNVTNGGRGVSISPVPLSPEDAWGVAPDGAIVLARAGAYRVDWIGAGGSVVQGPTMPYEPLPIGTAEKEQWDAERSRNVGLMVSVTRSAEGGTTTSFQRGGGRSAGPGGTDFSRYEWPESLPPVYAGRVPVDPLGRAWVRRHVGAGGAPTYDVFDTAGQRVGTVELGSDRQVVAFGEGVVYVVAFDPFDLNYLERYAMPEL